MTVTLTDGLSALPIAAATVTVAGQSKQTAASGSVRFADLAPGRHAVTASKTGYVDDSDSVDIAADDETVDTLALTPYPAVSPTSISATPATPDIIYLVWDLVPGALSYNVYWGTDSGVTKTSGNKIAGVASRFTHTGRTDGVTYYYVVTAVTPAGESPESPEVRATLLAGLAIEVTAPSINGLSGDSLAVNVRITSALQVTSVTATVEGRSAALAFQNDWRGTISLLGLARDTKQLVVSAQEISGKIAEVSVSFVYDRKPTLVISSPDDSSVAFPNVYLTASCADDHPGGCSGLNVTASDGPGGVPLLIASGQESVDQVVSLASFAGRVVLLAFVGVDSAGQQVRLERTVFVETNSHLQILTEVGGPIIDVSTDRILFVVDSAGSLAVKIHDRVSGVETDLIHGVKGVSGFLIPGGAIFVDWSGSPSTATVHEWQNGTLTDLGPSDASNSLRVSDPFAIWSNGSVLTRRDVVGGVNLQINGALNTNSDVAANGDVVYATASPPFQIHRFRNGVDSQLTVDSAFWNAYPVTDGAKVVYRKGTPCCGSPEQYSLHLISPTGEQQLAAARSAEPVPGLSYRITNGWIAYTDPTGGVVQVWTRDPLDATAQVSFFPTTSFLEALGPNGEVVFVNVSPGGGGAHRYRSLPPYGQTALTEISSGLGKVFVVNGQVLIAIRGVLFEVLP